MKKGVGNPPTEDQENFEFLFDVFLNDDDLDFLATLPAIVFESYDLDGATVEPMEKRQEPNEEDSSSSEYKPEIPVESQEPYDAKEEKEEAINEQEEVKPEGNATKERNRLAAQRSRNKKKQELETLLEKIEKFEEKQSSLLEELKQISPTPSSHKLITNNLNLNDFPKDKTADDFYKPGEKETLKNSKNKKEIRKVKNRVSSRKTRERNKQYLKALRQLKKEMLENILILKAELTTHRALTQQPAAVVFSKLTQRQEEVVTSSSELELKQNKAKDAQFKHG